MSKNYYLNNESEKLIKKEGYYIDPFWINTDEISTESLEFPLFPFKYWVEICIAPLIHGHGEDGLDEGDSVELHFAGPQVAPVIRGPELLGLEARLLSRRANGHAAQHHRPARRPLGGFVGDFGVEGFFDFIQHHSAQEQLARDPPPAEQQQEQVVLVLLTL